ncbi:hypothetical protein LOD99_4503 [Oopsacas minuta]|uniref:Actin n=1 Tax=Oopsacas minuta TaxID=111878 RepID=A0AAV7JSL3_9METZ|nr:hypothetical protein LOD99_4503 [Oopsacas minuta]
MADNDSFDEVQALVLDLGSDMIKYGFSGDDNPRTVFPNIVGKTLSSNNVMIGMPVREYFVGDEAQCKRGGLEMIRPILNGIIQDLYLFEKVLHHACYNELTVAPEDHPLLITEHPFNPKKNREDILQIAMETFNIPGVYFGIPGVLNSYALGKSSGLFIDCGCGVTSIVPVHNGEVLVKSIVRQNWAGDACTDRLTQLLQEIAIESTSREVVESMKTHVRYKEYDTLYPELAYIHHNKTDNENVSLYTQCMEPIFNPQILGSELLGLHQLAMESLKSCKESTHKDLCNKIVLSGGCTMFPGFETRFLKEFTELIAPEISTNIIAPPNRKYTTWIGGSKFAESFNFEKLMISNKEYNEYGPNIAYRKCPL